MPVQPRMLRAPGELPTNTRRYEHFRGVDFSTDPSMVDSSRSPYALNIISDAGGYPEKRPGWKTLHAIAGGAPVNGLFSLVDASDTLLFVAHVGTELYAWDETDAEPALILDGLNNTRSAGFTHDGVLYLLDGAHYLRFEGETADLVEGFIPTTVIGREPAGGGTPLEAVNLIQPYRKNSFIGNAGIAEIAQLQISTQATANGSVVVKLNGIQTSITVTTVDAPSAVAKRISDTVFAGWTTSVIGDTVTFTATTPGQRSESEFSAKDTGLNAFMITVMQGAPAESVYQLDSTELDAGPVVVSVAGVLLTETVDYSVNRETGQVLFAVPPPSGNGVDNVVITFAKTVPGYADRISRCTIAAWFGLGNDSRVFLAGNPDYPNMDWQSGLYDPTYFPDTGYTKVGTDSSAIMGYLKQFNDLLVVKEDNEQDATIFKRTAELDANNTAYFPLKQGVAGVGAVSKYAFGTLRDEPLFLAKEGVFATTTGFGDVTQQRYAQERSFFVKPRLIHEPNLADACAAVWNGLYVLCVNNHCYVADGRQKTGRSGTETAGYEWYYWDNIPAVCFMVCGDKLYFGTVDGRICMFSPLETVYRFSDDGQPITAIWSTIADDDGDWMRYKTVPRKGSGLMLKPYTQSSVDILVRTEADIGRYSKTETMDIFKFEAVDFLRFTFNTLDTPGIVPLDTKVKRYKTCQFILRNCVLNEGFGVYGILKRFTVDGIVK